MAEQYQYSPLGRNFVCLEQSPKQALSLINFGRSRVGRQAFKLTNRQLGVGIRDIVGARAGLRPRKPLLNLSHWGQLARRVHSGYRIFDLLQNRVTKVFDESADKAECHGEIEAARIAGTLFYAPELIDAAADDSWYCEEFWPGWPVASDAMGVRTGWEADFLSQHSAGLTTALDALIRLNEPERIDTCTYSEKIVTEIQDWIGAAKESNSTVTDRVQRFIDDTLHDLDDKKELFLVFSHGDLCLMNVISAEESWKVVDWEYGAHRSVLSDFFTLFTTEFYFDRQTIQTIRIAKNILARLLGGLDSSLGHVAASITSDIDLYRRFAHLERLATLTKRGTSEKRVHVVSRATDIFRSFDREWT